MSGSEGPPQTCRGRCVWLKHTGTEPRDQGVTLQPVGWVEAKETSSLTQVTGQVMMGLSSTARSELSAGPAQGSIPSRWGKLRECSSSDCRGGKMVLQNPGSHSGPWLETSLASLDFRDTVTRKIGQQVAGALL